MPVVPLHQRRHLRRLSVRPDAASGDAAYLRGCVAQRCSREWRVHSDRRRGHAGQCVRFSDKRLIALSTTIISHTLGLVFVLTTSTCDFHTDASNPNRMPGWTLVASSTDAPQDVAVAHHGDFATLRPGGGHAGVWGGLRDAMGWLHDVRFSCRAPSTACWEDEDVDISFTSVSWYSDFTSGTDADSCPRLPGDTGCYPARDNLLTGTPYATSDAYAGVGFGFGLEAECDSDDFIVDLLGGGAAATGAAGDESTRWGRVSGDSICGTAVASGGAATTDGFAWYVWVRPTTPPVCNCPGGTGGVLCDEAPTPAHVECGCPSGLVRAHSD